VSTANGAGAALDMLLTDAALAPSDARRLLQPGAAAGVVAGLVRRPGAVTRRTAGLGAELARVIAGRSERVPVREDRRFADPAWEVNWLLRRALQAYLAIGETVDQLISDSELDWRAERQARFAAGNLIDALAPTNFPWSNPAVLRETVDQGGANLVKGARRFARDVSRSPRLPATVDTSKFEIGGNLALTPGAVVLRTDVFELIQYKPQTPEVRELPLLVVPPTINKFYVLDLAPGRSIVEHLVSHGQQVFMISWRNPDAAHGHSTSTPTRRPCSTRARPWRRSRAGLRSTSPPPARGGSSAPACSVTWRSRASSRTWRA
jgi:polyhydroxyalkanoate synthase